MKMRGISKMRNKKAQGLSVSMIILIVLGLIIVGVLVFMIGGKVKQFGTSTNSCIEKNGNCVSAPEQCNGPILGSLNCPKEMNSEKAVCCGNL